MNRQKPYRGCQGDVQGNADLQGIIGLFRGDRGRQELTVAHMGCVRGLTVYFFFKNRSAIFCKINYIKHFIFI